MAATHRVAWRFLVCVRARAHTILRNLYGTEYIINVMEFELITGDFCFCCLAGFPSVVFAGPGATVTGASGLPLNPDTFSEISLDYNADDGASSTSSSRQPPAQYVASGQSATIAAVNLLPIVASTVFSSFSNIISGITSDSPAAPAAAPQPQQQYHHQPAQAPPAVHQFQPYPQPQPPPPPVAITPSAEQYYPQPTVPAEATAIAAVGPPPRLYSPHDPVTAAQPPSVRPPSGLPPPASSQSLHSANNTYRLNQKRKIYAPLPGLNTTHVPVHPSTDIPHQPFVAPAQPAAPQFAQPPTPAASPSPFSLTALIHKVPLLDKFQQLAVSPAAPVPATQPDSAFATAPVYSSPPVLATPPPPAAQQQLYFHPSAATPPLRQTSTPTTSYFPAAAYAPAELQQPAPPVRKTSTPFAIHNQQSAPNPSNYFQPQPPSQFQTPPCVQSAVAAPPAVPPTLAAHLPPPSTGSSYRLKGKPLYKSPNTYGTVATATHFQPPVAAAVGPYPVAQLYDPLQSSGVPTTHAYVSAPQLPIQPAPTVAFFNPTAATDVPDLPAAVVESQTFSNPPVVPEPVAFFSPDVPKAAIETQTFGTAVAPETVAFFNPSLTPSVPIHSVFNPTSSSSDLQQSNSSFSTVQDITVLSPAFAVTPVPIHPTSNSTFNPTTATYEAPAEPSQAINTSEDVELFSTTSTNEVRHTVEEAAFVPPAGAFTSVPFYPVFNPTTSTPETAAVQPPADRADQVIDYDVATLDAVTKNISLDESSSISFFNPTTSNEVAETPQHPPLYPTTSTTPANYFNATQSDQSAVVSAVNPIGAFNPFIAPTEPEAHPEPTLPAIAQPTASPSVGTVNNPAHFFTQTIQQHPERFSPIQSEAQVVHGTPQTLVPSIDRFVAAAAIEENPVNYFNVITASSDATVTTQAPLIPASNPIDFFNYHSSSQHQSAPFNPFETAFAPEPAHLAAVRPRETPFDNYIALEQQTRSSFIQSDDCSREDTLDIVPNVDLPDLVTPAASEPIESTVAQTDANLNIAVAPVAASTPTPVASDLFQTTHTLAASHSTFASFFDTPAANTNANNNWFNPIATPIATPASQSNNTPLHKPNPTDPINFFAQAPPPVVSAVTAHEPNAPEQAISASVSAAPSLDIVNNSQIANFFNNPPPLPDDATQQQLDLVKDCNRNFQASVNQNHTGGGAVANHDNGLATGPGPLAQQIVQPEQQLQQQHRRLGEVAQHFAAFAGGAGSEFGIDTRSFASSNVVEPASSFQSELSEYAASVAGSQSIVGQPPAGEVSGFVYVQIIYLLTRIICT